jgi:4-hydroxy-tetrahydrodipicolinate reductase
MFLGNDEIVTLSHTALSRRIFEEGALKAAFFLKDKSPGLYSMRDLFRK